MFVLQGGGNMATTIVDTILDPKYQKEFMFKNIYEKIKLCEELKTIEEELSNQLDAEHKKLLSRYNEIWDMLHTDLSIDTFANGLNFADEG